MAKFQDNKLRFVLKSKWFLELLLYDYGANLKRNIKILNISMIIFCLNITKRFGFNQKILNLWFKKKTSKQKMHFHWVIVGIIVAVG